VPLIQRSIGGEEGRHVAARLARGGEHGHKAPHEHLSPARRVADLLLEAVLEQHRALEEALDGIPAAIEPRDKAAGHRIAAAVLRRTGSLDAVMEPFLRRSPARARPCARCASAPPNCCCWARPRMPPSPPPSRWCQSPSPAS
jgi:hypothetical protein